MTKEEFIHYYLTNSRRLGQRTPDGYKSGEHEYIAIPCECGDEICKGWRMVSKHEGE